MQSACLGCCRKPFVHNTYPFLPLISHHNPLEKKRREKNLVIMKCISQ